MTQPVLQSRIEQLGDLVLQPFDTSFEHVSKVLAALGTRCFMPTLPMPTQQLKQALRANQPLGDFNLMTPAAIRAQLEQLAATGSASAAEHNRLCQAWQAVKPQTPQSYHPVVEDRLKALKP